MRAAYLVLTVLLFLCLLPVLGAFAAYALAGPLGCSQSGPGFTNCTLFGTDLSEAVTTATTLHWLGLITLPCAALFAVLLGLLALLDLIRRLRR